MAEIWDKKFPWSIEAQHANGKCLGILPTLDYNHKLHTVLLGYYSYLAVMYMSENIGTIIRADVVPNTSSSMM